VDPSAGQPLARERDARGEASELLEGDPGAMGDLERNRLAMESELEPNIRLSCQIHVNSDLKVRVINQASVRGMDAGPRPLDE